HTLQESSRSTDHGSRSKRHEKGKKEPKTESGVMDEKVRLDISKLEDEFEQDLIGPDEDLTGIVIDDDEAEKELYSALNKTRKLKLKENNDNINPALDIVKILQESQDTKEEEDESSSLWVNDNGALVLNTTAEFCRNLGDLPRHDAMPVVKAPPPMDEDDDDNVMDMQEDMAGDFVDDGEKYRNNWNEVDIKMEDDDEQFDDVKPSSS